MYYANSSDSAVVVFIIYICGIVGGFSLLRSHF